MPNGGLYLKTVYRRYILLWGLCFITAGVFYILAKSFDISAFGIISGFALFGVIYFLIRILISERKAKKKKLLDSQYNQSYNPFS